ncbi:unnamed protein product [Camellia sinensis]
MEIQHFSHNHPLTPHEEGELKTAVKCSCCDLPISAPFYGCTICNFFIHKSCSELPRELDQLHIFHPIHPLTLLSRPPRNSTTFKCYACEKSRRGFIYHCSHCQLDLCINCVSLVPPSKNPDEYHQIQLPTHEHPFILCPKDEKFDLSCIDCHLPIEEDSLYLCPICILFFHQSCADPPPKINHPFHSKHPLILLYWASDCKSISFRCNACGRHGSGRTYHCADCGFNMHVPCSRLMPTVKSDIHQHPLAFFQFYIDISLICQTCDRRLDRPYFRCVECDFSLHLDCYPSLPHFVKHVSHRHYLTITDSPIKDYSDEDDDSEFYCDACEERRNLYDRSYFCAEPECHFVAHIKCLISEILPLLEEEWSLASKIVKQKSDKEVISSLVEEPVPVAGVSVGIEAMENPTLAELDVEIAKLQVEIEVLTAKLGALEMRRTRLAATTL